MRIYLLGICGTGVGALAGLLKARGHEVYGSDEHVYPPMSDKLKEWQIKVLDGYDAAHLRPHPDLVIVGNVIRAGNPEAIYAREQSLPMMSMPQAVAEFGIQDRHSIVIAGTHGKTSVTALVAHVLLSAGLDPSFLVGGALVGHSESFRVGTGRFFVIEGDEYDTAFFDKGPKFLHYRARTAVVTSLEYDHADIFADVGAVERAFQGLIATLPEDGHLVVCDKASRARRLAQMRPKGCRLTVYAAQEQREASLHLSGYRSGPQGVALEPILQGRSLGRMQVPVWGEFGAENVLAAIAGLADADLSPAQLRDGLESFQGVRRRMEIRGEPGGVTVVDDFAHHPTAVAATLAAARSRWPGRKIWALFEPRSATTRRNVFQEAFVEAFSCADQVGVGSHERLREIPEADRLDPDRLVRELRQRQVAAHFEANPEALAAQVASEAKAGDVIMIFSNGTFGGLHGKLLERLRRAEAV